MRHTFYTHWPMDSSSGPPLYGYTSIPCDMQCDTSAVDLFTSVSVHAHLWKKEVAKCVSKEWNLKNTMFVIVLFINKRAIPVPL